MESTSPAGGHGRPARVSKTVDAIRTRPDGPLPIALKAVLVAEILIAYVRVRLAMRTTDFREVMKFVRARHTTHARIPDRDAMLVARRLGMAVNRTLQALPTDSRCLVQALVLSWLLASRNISAVLVIGAHSEPEFQAHAWVEHAGRPLLPVLDYYESRLLEI